MGDDTLDQLDETSRSIAAALFAVYPEWRALALIEFELGDDEPHLKVTAPRPAGDLFLVASTVDGELTVQFAGFHDHFDWCVGERPDGNQHALDLIASVLADRLIIASGWTGEQPRGVWRLAPGDPLPIADCKLMGGTQMLVRSWSGELDADLELS